MNKLLWLFSLLVVFAGLALLGQPLAVWAAEDASGGAGDRIARLERRVNEMAERQEQLIRRLEAQVERQQPPMRPLVKRSEAKAAPAGPEKIKPLRPTANPPAPAPAVSNAIHKVGDLVRMCLLVCFVFNILLAIWIYTDIRKRGEGSGLFVALALLAGIPATLIYSLVRLGDKKA